MPLSDDGVDLQIAETVLGVHLGWTLGEADLLAVSFRPASPGFSYYLSVFQLLNS